MSILKKGLAGEPVKILQQKLGVPADGQFGVKTEEALKAYQKEHGLSADGIAGPDTFAALGLYELVLLKVGTSGGSVKKLQAALNINADGKFGRGTREAVVDFQSKNGLEPDGFAGPTTLAKLGVFTGITADVISRSQVSGSAPAATAKQTAPSLQPSGDVEPTATAAGAPLQPSSAPPAAASTAEAPARSIWSTIKSFFS